MNLEAVINEAHEQRAALSPSSAPPEVRSAVEQTIAQLDAGTLRVAEKRGSEWASSRLGELRIVEVPDGVDWEIDEYDGVESIHEKHQVWG